MTERPAVGRDNLAIGEFTHYPAQALGSVKCITSLRASMQYMVNPGNPAARLRRLMTRRYVSVSDGRSDPYRSTMPVRGP